MEGSDNEEEDHATVASNILQIRIQLSPPASWTSACPAADVILAPNLLAPHYMWRMSSNAEIVVAAQMSGRANDGLENGASSRPSRPYLSLPIMRRNTIDEATDSLAPTLYSTTTWRESCAENEVVHQMVGTGGVGFGTVTGRWWDRGWSGGIRAKQDLRRENRAQRDLWGESRVQRDLWGESRAQQDLWGESRVKRDLWGESRAQRDL